jgi:PAS domain S-box-containing protein
LFVLVWDYRYLPVAMISNISNITTSVGTAIQHVDPTWVWFVLKCGAVATAATAIYKVLFKPMQLLIKQTTKFYEQVNFITAELKPNGGNSMRDQVDSIRAICDGTTQKMRIYFHFDPHGIVETDKDGGLVWMNRAYLEITGYMHDELTGMGWRNAISPQDRDRVFKEWSNAVAEKRDFYAQFTIEQKSGYVAHVEARCLAIRTAKGDLVGHLGFMKRTDQPPPGCRWCREVEMFQDMLIRMTDAEREATLTALRCRHMHGDPMMNRHMSIDAPMPIMWSAKPSPNVSASRSLVDNESE